MVQKSLGLRGKLLAITSFFLLVPWLGYEYIRELERFLRLVFGAVDETPTQEEHAMFLAYASSLRLIADGTTITGTSIAGSPRIVELDGYEIDATPSGAMLITQHADVPGMIGRVGTILGDARVNISTMQVSRNTVGGDAIMVLSTDRPAGETTLAALRAIPGVGSVRSLAV